jgi:enoyl-[acyl-carrier protein] reductase I
MGFLSGKRALIVGVASDRSIAWGIAQAMHAQGAELAFSYVNEKFKERVQPLAESLGSKLTMQLDVTNDAEIDTAFAAVKQAWGSLDIVVHAVAYAPREALAGGFVESTSREAFRVAHDVSSYSLTALARAARPLMEGRAGAILTLSYLGAVKSIPSYNVMGLAKASLEANVRFLAADMGPNNVRVNGISAGPIKTLAAAGIATITAHAESASTLIAVRHMSRMRSSTSSTPIASVGKPTAARMIAMPTSEAAGIPATPMDVINARITTVNCVLNDRCSPYACAMNIAAAHS